MPKSVPAAPAVAKKPITYVNSTAITPIALKAPSASAVTPTWAGPKEPTPPTEQKNNTTSMVSGIKGRYVATLATYWIPFKPIKAAAAAQAIATIIWGGVLITPMRSRSG
jgi:hypothetical protein